MKTVMIGLGIACSFAGVLPVVAGPPAQGGKQGAKPAAKAAPPAKVTPKPVVETAEAVRVTFPVGHTSEAYTAAMSPDGRLVATAGFDDEIILWERATGNEIARLAQGKVYNMAFSPDGKRLAVASNAASAIWAVQMFDVATREKIWEGYTGGNLRDMAFSPAGNRLAVASELSSAGRGGVYIWDTVTGKKDFEFITVNNKNVQTVAWMPNGTQVVAGSEGGDVVLCDAVAGTALRTLFNIGMEKATALEVHPDGRRILVGTLFRNEARQPVNPVQVWSIDGKPLQNFPVTRPAGSEEDRTQGVHWAEGGKAVVAAFHTHTPAHVWEADGTLRQTYPFPLPYQAEFTVSQDGAFALFPNKMSATLVRLADGESKEFTGRKLPVSSVAFSENGKWGVIGSQTGEIRLIEAGTGRSVRRYTNLVEGQAITAVSISADGERACAATYASNPQRALIVVWETATGKQLLRWQAPDEWSFPNAVLSSDGKTVVGGNLRGEVRGWNVETGRELFGPVKPHGFDTIHAIAFRPDNQAFAIAVQETVMVLNAQTGQTLKTFNLPRSRSAYGGAIDWSADGQYVAYVKTPLNYSTYEFYLFDAENGTFKGWYDPSAGSLAAETPGWIAGGGIRGFAPGATVANGFRIPGAKSKTTVGEGSDAPSEWVLRNAFVGGGRFQRSLTPNGGITFYEVQRGSVALTLLPLAGDDTNPGGEWLAYDETGRFTGSEGAMQTVAVVTGPTGRETSLPISRFFERYYTPSLVTSTLGSTAGPGKPAGTVLPLPPLPSPSQALKTGAPPLVRLVVPSSVNTPTVEVAIEATEQAKGGVKAIRLYHNGRLVGGPSVLRGIGIEAVAGATTTKKFTVALASGANEFRAVAYSNSDLESKPAVASVKFQAGAVAKPVLHVLSVGINTYKDATMNLTYARPDAEALADLFDSAKGGKGGGRLFSSVRVSRLIDTQATGEAILSSIGSLVTTSKPEDVVLIYLAGHGETAEDVWYFLPTEMRQMALTERVQEFGIPWAKIEAAVGKISARKIVLVLDACKSGAVVNGVRGGVSEQQALAVMARAQGIHILTASNAQQYAGEVQALGHGILTYALLEGLNGKAGATGDAAIMVRDVLSYVENRVPELSLKYRGEAQYPTPLARGQNFPVAGRP
jgi:WD40 repeat protein